MKCSYKHVSYCFIACLIPGIIFGQTYKIKSNSANSGGTNLSGTTYQSSTSTAGSPISITTSTTYQLISGFQATLFSGAILPGTDMEILTYSIPGETVPATIDISNHEVTVVFPFGTDVTNLVAEFTLSAGSTVKVDDVAQTSTVTPNDFTNPVTYVVTAEDGTTTQDWIVTVTFAPNTATDFLTFVIPDQVGSSVINTTAHSIAAVVPFGTDLTELIAEFTLSPQASAKIGDVVQESGISPNNFSSPVIYAVVAGDNSTTQEWTVSVAIAPNNAADILSYSIPGQVSATTSAAIDNTEHTIAVNVPFGTDLTALVATFTLSPDATALIGSVIQESGTTANDFSGPVVYTVTAQDDTTQNDWTVTVTPLPNNETVILSYNFSLQSGETTINEDDHTIALEVPSGTNLSGLVASFTLSPQATAKVGDVLQESGTTANEFTNPVIYLITAGDGTTMQEWTVTVTVASPPADTSHPDITQIIMPEEFPFAESTVSASVKVTDDRGVKEVILLSKKFESSSWTSENVSGDNDIYSVNISKSSLGAMGMKYYFRASDEAGNADSTDTKMIIFTYTSDEGPEIPSLTFGATVDKYQIISIPLDLDNKGVTAVFQDLGAYNIKQWRLFHYDGSTKEFGSGFSTIEPGLGYWLIVRNSTAISIGAGKALKIDQDGNYTIQLKPGYNQIGNPFNFTLNWDDVISYNNIADIGRVKLFSAGTLNEGSTLSRFRGGFVYLAGSNTINVKVPAAPATSGRKLEAGIIEQLAENPIDSKNWALPISMSNLFITNRLTAIGMHEEALVSKDRFDDILLPVPASICSYKAYFPHEEYSKAAFSRDFVPTDNTYTWNIKLTTVDPGEKVKLTWDNTRFGTNNKTLMLEDLQNRQLINMRENNNYIIQTTGENKIRIHYGDADMLADLILPEEISLGDPYPNPFIKEISIPFTVADNIDPVHVLLCIRNSLGQQVAELVNEPIAPGYHSATWSIEANGIPVSNGLYLVHMNVTNGKFNKTISRRILLTQ